MDRASASLFGRNTFLEEVERVLHETGGSLAGLLVVSLQGVRAVNRELGYAAGDHMLDSLAAALAAILRDGDRLARLGSSEFVMFLPSLFSTAQGILAAQRILELTGQPLDIAGLAVRLHLDVGIAFFPDHADSAEELLRCADLALDTARRRRAGFYVYDPDAEGAPLLSSVALEGELARALHAGELSVSYQPLLDTRAGQVCGMEALLRWHSRSRGAVSPAQFIPIAESSGLITPITDWVLNTALRETQRVRDHHGDVSLAVNLSASVLHDPDTVGLVSRAIGLWGVNASGLTLEVTESSMMADPDASRSILEQLSALDVRIAIDDFGTGYSSLAYLAGLPCTELKIDRSFVMKMLTDERSETIVRAVTNLAHTLGLVVVAEGVEDEAALAVLGKLGCDRAQGFLFGRPMPIDDFVEWLENGAWRPRKSA